MRVMAGEVMLMDAIGASLRRLSALFCALALMSAPALAQPAAPSVRTVTIARGESYVIRGADPKHSPELETVDNPNALIVKGQADGDVLVLGAEAGSGTVRVTMTDGTVQTYAVTVRSLSNAANPLAPGSEPPPAASEPSVEAKSLDSGAGPLPSGRPETLVAPRPAAAPASPPETAAESAATSPGAGGPPSTVPSASTEPATAGAPLEARAPNAPNVSQVSPLGRTTPLNPAAADKLDDGTVAANAAHYLPDDAIALMSGTSRLFDLPAPIKRLSIADSTIADIQVVNPHQLMLVGHKPGFTTLAVWDAQGHYEERQVHIEQTGEQQVLLNCVVAEVNRQKLENQGVNLSLAFPKAGVSGFGLPGSVSTPYSPQSQLINSPVTGNLPPAPNLVPLVLSNTLSYGLSTDNGSVLSQSFFQYLEAHSLGRILAEPHILANSGEEAKFLSGGEIPIVIAQALNTSVVFKQFGTSVTFIPTVIGRHAIELTVRPEVSKPDFSQGVQLFGFTVPAFVTRKAETVVRMNDAQTLIIAGLILRDRQATVDKVPYLGDLPLMGGLFRHTSFQDTQTELVMSVTPQIVTPLPEGSQVAYPEGHPMQARDIRTGRLSEPDVSRPRF